MITFIKGIFYDLTGRIQKMIVDLESRAGQTEISNAFFDKTLHELSKLNQQVNEILASGDLLIPELTSNFLIKYNTFHERFLAIEIYRYQVIIHYGKNEKYFNALISKIYDEIECDQSTPIVAGISNNDSYYWAYPTYDIIAVPYGEEKNLLNLPDLYHEIGHLIFSQFDSFLKGSIDLSLTDYFTSEIDSIDDEGRDNSKKLTLRKAYDNWRDSWIEEFICDLIATFLTGTAYGWTNMKICIVSNSDKGIYSFTANHPPDESRMYAIFGMLRLMGLGEDIQALKASWEAFTSVAARAKTALYETLLPRDLIDQLVATVHATCQNIGLLSYTKQIEKVNIPITKLLNDAWIENLERPETFTTWENKVTEELRQSLINDRVDEIAV